VNSCVIAMVLAAVAAPADEPVTVECDGAVEWTASEGGSSRLKMSGGVRVVRAGATLRSASADVSFDRGATTVTRVDASGGVALTSDRFSAIAAAARMTARPVPEGGPAGPPLYDVRLMRGNRPWVELRSGELVVSCAGDLEYDADTRTATLRGGVRGSSGTMTLCAEQVRVVFTPAPAAAAVRPAPEAGDGPAEEPRRQVDRAELTGAVEVRTTPPDGSPARLVRAERALYDAASGVLTFKGLPAPRVESTGIVLTAPELRLYLHENRIESSTGTMKAVVDPPGGGAK
jgi:lipopolysaccharide export system protein LptA